jgi:hypothetical protein
MLKKEVIGFSNLLNLIKQIFYSTVPVIFKVILLFFGSLVKTLIVLVRFPLLPEVRRVTVT